MQVSTHDLITPAANKQHKIEDQLPEYFNHGRILAPLAGIIPNRIHYTSTGDAKHPGDTNQTFPLLPCLK